MEQITFLAGTEVQVGNEFYTLINDTDMWARDVSIPPEETKPKPDVAAQPQKPDVATRPQPSLENPKGHEWFNGTSWGLK